MILRAFAWLFALPLVVESPTRDLIESARDRRGSELLSIRDVRLLAADGSEVRLGDRFAEGEVLVLCATGVGCPISGKLAGRLTRTADAYARRGVRFLGFNSSPQDTISSIESDRKALGLGFPVLKDHRQELARALDARTTTEVFVFDSAGRLRYRGAVDDQYSIGAARPEPTKHHLVEALEAVLTGAELACAETSAPGCLLTILPASELPEVVSWSSDVAKILQARCESCHRPGAVGPFSLQTYEQARGHSQTIAAVLEEGRMPPWNADERYDGVFSNQRALPDGEKQKLLRWIDEGMARGDPAEDPSPKEWPTGWSIGEPDAVFAMERRMGSSNELPEKGFAVPREGVVEYEYFTAKTDFPEDRWIQAIEVRPGATDVVHHVLVLIDDPRVPGSRVDFRSYLAVAVPGDTPSIYPPGYGKRLPAGATLIFQLHYTPNGKERFDRSSLAMRFCEEAPEFEVVTSAVVNDEFEIPPGATNHEVRGEVLIREDTGLVALFPHMHTRGADFRYVAHYPDGTDEELLYSHYDFNWQEAYLLPDPRPIPAGTRLECVGHFDNSAGNPNNPDPSAKVRWGEQTFEEMFVGYFDTVKPVE